METIKKAGGSLLEDVSLFDVYMGEQVPEGYKSVAFTLRLRDPNKTLRDEDAQAVFAHAVEALATGFKAKLRGI